MLLTDKENTFTLFQTRFLYCLETFLHGIIYFVMPYCKLNVNNMLYVTFFLSCLKIILGLQALLKTGIPLYSSILKTFNICKKTHLFDFHVYAFCYLSWTLTVCCPLCSIRGYKTCTILHLKEELFELCALFCQLFFPWDTFSCVAVLFLQRRLWI